MSATRGSRPTAAQRAAKDRASARIALDRSATDGLLDAEAVRAPYEERRANRERAAGASYVDECFLCGRPMTEGGLARAAWVHCVAGGSSLLAVALDYTDPAGANDDLGWFPIGSECARRLPARFKLKDHGAEDQS